MQPRELLMAPTLHIGLVVNPLAGVGGRLAMKGSDGEAARLAAVALDASRASAHAVRALRALGTASERIEISTWGSDMGETAVSFAGL